MKNRTEKHYCPNCGWAVSFKGLCILCDTESETGPNTENALAPTNMEEFLREFPLLSDEIQLLKATSEFHTLYGKD